MLVNNIDFCGEEGAAFEAGEVREVRIFSEQPTELLPGGLGLDVREIPGGELGAAHCQTLVLLHLVEFLVEHV